MLIACVAPGPSLTSETCDRLAGRCQVLAVNNAYQLAPWADWLYACDNRWWETYHADVANRFEGECWTQSPDAARDFGLQHVRMAPVSTRHERLSTTPGVIHGGYNGGYQAVNLALHFGATRILLVGYDMRVVAGRHHFFGEYREPTLARTREYERWARAYDSIRPADYGLEIINCTPGSAIKAFPFMALDDAL